MARRVCVVLNPAAAAGRALHRWNEFAPKFAQAGLATEVLTTSQPGQAVELARHAATSGYDGIVAAGGDGTCREVGQGLLEAGSDTPFAALPLGTGNDFASQAGFRTVAETVAALVQGTSHRGDVIEVCTAGPAPPRIALNFAAVGFAVDLLRQTTPAVKRWFGSRLCYWAGFFRALRHHQPPSLRIRADGVEFADRFLHVSASNLEFSGGGVMRLAPGARADDGRLEFCLITAQTRGQILRRFPHLLRGTHPRLAAARFFHG